MRPEKKYLVEEVSQHLAKSDYVFLADFNRMTVDDTAELRASLAQEQAEFHVVKNSILNVAARERNLPDLSEWLTGQTAVVVGGSNPSGVAKALAKFFKAKEKVEVKVGILGDRAITSAEVGVLANLPDLDTLRAQLLSLLNTPATQLVRVIIAVPQGLLNVLQAKADKEGAN
jgi:large subunit ribosomal protein L10